MARLPYAAKVLIGQVKIAKPKTKDPETVDEPDGLGVNRTIRFNKTVGKWLAPLLEEAADPRVQTLVGPDDKGLEVTFVADHRADDKAPFPLEDAAQVLDEASRAPARSSVEGERVEDED